MNVFRNLRSTHSRILQFVPSLMPFVPCRAPNSSYNPFQFIIFAICENVIFIPVCDTVEASKKGTNQKWVRIVFTLSLKGLKAVVLYSKWFTLENFGAPCILSSAVTRLIGGEIWARSVNKIRRV